MAVWPLARAPAAAHAGVCLGFGKQVKT